MSTIKIKLPQNEDLSYIQPFIRHESGGFTKEEWEIINKANQILGPIASIGYSQKFGGDFIKIVKTKEYLLIEIDEKANIEMKEED